MAKTLFRVSTGALALIAAGLVIGCSVETAENEEIDQVEQPVSRECTDLMASNSGTSGPTCCYGIDDCYVTLNEKLWHCNSFFGPAFCYRLFSPNSNDSPVSYNVIEAAGLTDKACVQVTISPSDTATTTGNYCYLSKSFSGVNAYSSVKVTPNRGMRAFLHSQMDSYLSGNPGSYNCRYSYKVLSAISCLGVLP